MSLISFLPSYLIGVFTAHGQLCLNGTYDLMCHVWGHKVVFADEISAVCLVMQ